MKKFSILFLVFIFFFPALKAQGSEKEESSKNKEVAAKYHELKASDVKTILTEDFIGRNEKSRFTWNRDDHIKYLTGDTFKKDSIYQQVAEGDWVATRFIRTMDWNGKRIKVEAMQFKRFKNGKIAEIWEYGDTKQVDDSN